MEKLEEVRKSLKTWTDLRSSMIATVGAFIIAFFGSWVQLNTRISKVETHVEHHTKSVEKIDEINNNVQQLIEQGRWIIRELQRNQENED